MDSDKEKILVKCAGVLIISIIDDVPSVLLGLSRKKRNGKYLYYWSDFGGKSNLNETSSSTASRELFEETCGLYSISPKILEDSPKILFEREHLSYTQHIVIAPFVSEKFMRSKFYSMDSEKADCKWVPLKKFIKIISIRVSAIPSGFRSHYGKFHPLHVSLRQNKKSVLDLRNTLSTINKDLLTKSKSQAKCCE